MLVLFFGALFLLSCSTPRKESIEVERKSVPQIISVPEVKYTYVVKQESTVGLAEVNIKRAIQIIGVQQINRGEEFSFNTVLGARTAENGFIEAPALFGGVPVLDFGGGVCQVSTVIYRAALNTGLEVVERHSHSRPVPYVEIGLDSAVNYPDLDLRIKNNIYEYVKFYLAFEDGVISVVFEFSTTIKNSLRDYSSWVQVREIPYKTIYLNSKYIKKEFRHRKGENGFVGYRKHTFLLDNKEHVIKVKSNYKAIDEVIVRPE